jgi:hypothetical protein
MNYEVFSSNAVHCSGQKESKNQVVHVAGLLLVNAVMKGMSNLEKQASSSFAL